MLGGGYYLTGQVTLSLCTPPILYNIYYTVCICMRGGWRSSCWEGATTSRVS